jgi:hypothetical protein
MAWRWRFGPGDDSLSRPCGRVDAHIADNEPARDGVVCTTARSAFRPFALIFGKSNNKIAFLISKDIAVHDWKIFSRKDCQRPLLHRYPDTEIVHVFWRSKRWEKSIKSIHYGMSTPRNPGRSERDACQSVLYDEPAYRLLETNASLSTSSACMTKSPSIGSTSA